MTANAASFDAFATLITQIASIEVDPASVRRTTTLTGDLMLDSISLVSLLALAEEHFGIDLAAHADQIADLRNVGDAVDLIDSLASAKA